jgi:hypothetical protein
MAVLPFNPNVQHQPYPEHTESEVTNKSVLELDSGFLRFKTYPTPQDILDFGLKGIPKRFFLTGEEITADYIEPFLASAIAEIEMVGLTISPVIKTHNEDFHDQQFTKNYLPIVVPACPILDVEAINLIYPHVNSDQPMHTFQIPKGWITWDKNKINVIASTGVLAPTMLNQTSSPILAIWTSAVYKPNTIACVYQAGFPPDKLPYNLWKLIIDKTVFSLLIDIGPLLLPMQSMAVGIDGVSQSASTPGIAFLDMRMKNLQKQIDKSTRQILGYYGIGLKISFIGM